MRGVRQAVGGVAHRTGSLAALHRLRNRETLTTVTFHRVLPAAERDRLGADPRYTATPEFLEACLRFFRRHCALVGLEAVAASIDGSRPLPPRALLVTFDDGWADNRVHALPVLRAAAVPAVLFATTGALGHDAPFWQERLFGGWRLGELGDGVLRLIWRATSRAPAPAVFGEPELRALIRELAALQYEERLALLATYEIGAYGGGMLRRSELEPLTDAGIAIGGHGVTHEPIPDAPDPVAELRGSRRELDPLLGPAATMSFPHGRYDGHSIVAARRAGWRILFTSDTVLEAAPRGRLRSSVLGRIGIPMPVLTDDAGRLLPDRLALWLFRRPIRRPVGPWQVV